MNEQLKREEGIHGPHWNEVHGGYFSSPAIAAPLIRKIQELANQSKTDRIIDLGGGTGFLLSQLATADIRPNISLVNLDQSAPQLEAAKPTGFSCVHGSIDSFSRPDVGPLDGHFLFMMRSVLHYFGKNGLRPVLRHLRAQVKPGEFFVHQTASFSRPEEADCLNLLYQLMRTPKWYPTLEFLCTCLSTEGWRVREVLPAAPLTLTSGDLRHRYHLEPREILEIRDRLSQCPGVSEAVFKTTNNGFCAYLHYSIYVCTPLVSG